jgi:NAD(P)-dependent dehydrogenase (short-subunit alcohol dehydrogenase family)
MSQTILITGTNSGFGRMMALDLARKGHTVFAAMRDIGGRNRAVAEEYAGIAKDEGVKLHVVEMAVTDDESVEAAVKSVLEQAGHLDVVINNAGYAAMGPQETLTAEQLLAQLNVNVVGPHRVLRAALPSMRARGKGYMIHISSLLGRMTMPLMGAYCASKAALESLVDAYSYELKGVGIESTIVQPGAYPTDFAKNSPAGADADRAAGYGPLANWQAMLQENFKNMFSGPNPPNPQDVSDAVVALVETEAGSRPGRVTVDKLMPGTADVLNKAHEEIQQNILAFMGMA